jgi:hypothetical protein
MFMMIYFSFFNKNLKLWFKFQNAGMTDCSASSQSGTRLKKTNDAGTGPVLDKPHTVWHFFSPVPDSNSGRCNADAGFRFLDADA